jgi:hypothetical protein
VNAAVYGKTYNNEGAFSPLEGLFLSVARGGERATVVLSSHPGCDGAANATMSVTVGGVVAPQNSRSKDGRRITVTLPPYDSAWSPPIAGSDGSKTITVTGSLSTGCKPGYEKSVSGKYCYKLSKRTGLSWVEARAICQQEGSDLASIGSKEDAVFLEKVVPVWIGLTDEAKENTWVNVDGTTPDPTWLRWESGEPNDGGVGENCAVIGNANSWNDLPCNSSETKSERIRFVCGHAFSTGVDMVTWSCPPSCPTGQAATTNRSALYSTNTKELRAALGGITYVRRCDDGERRLQQNNDSTPLSPQSAEPASSSSSLSQCEKAKAGTIPFVTDPRSCLDPARAHTAPCAFGEGGECECCPANARCPGGARTWPDRGYWVERENSTAVSRCGPPQMKRCMGMVHGGAIGNQCGAG